MKKNEGRLSRGATEPGRGCVGVAVEEQRRVAGTRRGRGGEEEAWLRRHGGGKGKAPGGKEVISPLEDVADEVSCT